MDNLIDITEILENKQKQLWFKHVLLSIKNARNEAEKLRWTEIKLALQFEEYYRLNGVCHPNDPMNIDTDCYLT